MKKYLAWALCFGAVCFSGTLWAAVTCVNENTAVAESTSTADFTINADGTVTDTKTGLMWMQCSLGQTWNGTDCSTGSAATYSWEDALQIVQTFNSGASDPDGDGSAGFAGLVDWRLPNKNELESIVEPRCWTPAINAEIFPNTYSSWYWSSTRHTFDGTMAWHVNFSNGDVLVWRKSLSNAVRLVRTAE